MLNKYSRWSPLFQWFGGKSVKRKQYWVWFMGSTLCILLNILKQHNHYWINCGINIYPVITNFWWSDILLTPQYFWISSERQMIIWQNLWDQLSQRNFSSPNDWTRNPWMTNSFECWYNHSNKKFEVRIKQNVKPLANFSLT
jgi:hypothetical protein